MSRIALISPGLSDGGAERVAAILANELSQRGHDVLFVAAFSAEREYELHEKVSYCYIDCNKANAVSRLLDRSKKLEDIINSFQAEYVISFIVREMLRFLSTAKIPVIYSLRIDPAVATKGILNSLIFDYSYSRAKNIVFQTNDARNFFKSKIRNKGVVIGNPLSKELPEWILETAEKRIITACRLSAQKNLKMLIKGFALFHQSHEDYRLEIYGKGPMEAELKKYVEDMAMQDHISFPGHSKEIHKVMSQSAAFALTSDFEGLSNSMLESLAIGLPTICTDCPPGGAKTYINNGYNGYLIPMNDSEALAECLAASVDDVKKSEEISRHAKEIRTQLSISCVVDEWESLLTN